MATEFVLGHEKYGQQIKIGHAHCKDCGVCLFNPSVRHKCPTAVDPAILEVFLSETKAAPSRSKSKAVTA